MSMYIYTDIVITPLRIYIYVYIEIYIYMYMYMHTCILC